MSVQYKAYILVLYSIFTAISFIIYIVNYYTLYYTLVVRIVSLVKNSELHLVKTYYFVLMTLV